MENSRQNTESTTQPFNYSTQLLITYTLHLADNALILGHRNSEWAGHGPILEQDIAISNIALDLIGQARNFYQYAAELSNNGGSADGNIIIGQERLVTEDSLAYLRDAIDFKNCLLVEQPNGDWAKTILRQFFFSAYQFYFYRQLINSSDERLSAIAEKALKEVTYHLKWSAEWVIRLGDGTEESHRRLKNALEDLWRFTFELTRPAEYETSLVQNNIAGNLSNIKEEWSKKVFEILSEARIWNENLNSQESFNTNGKTGNHTEHLGFILAEMQFLQRAYPRAEW